MGDAPFRIGIIGLGMAAAPHAEALLALEGQVEVVAAFSPSTARREGFAARFGLPVVDSADAIFGDDSIRAVLILTPPNSHLELVERAAGAAQHVLLEKPLDISLARAEAVVAACRRHGVALGVVLQNRYRAASRALLGLMAEGRLGRVISASIRVDNWRAQSYYDEPGRGTHSRDGGGVLLTQAIHTIDLFLAAAGAPTEIFGYAATSPVHVMETEDIAVAAMRFAGGGMGTLEATTTAYPGAPERIELVGERGTARLTGSEIKAWFHDGSTLTEGAAPAATGGVVPVMAPSHDLHLALIEDFVAAIKAGRPVPVDGEKALLAQRFIETLLRSAAERRALPFS